MSLWIRERNMNWMIPQLDDFVSDLTTIPRGFQLMDHTEPEAYCLSACALRHYFVQGT